MTKILLVEDDKSLREIYGVRLLAEGYEIVSAGDGEEAIAIAVKERPDMIISDVMMPKISGFDLLDLIRSTPELKDVKVIMMTALSSEEQRERGVRLGADRYLVKSQVGIEDVVRTVHEVLADSATALSDAQVTHAEEVTANPELASTGVAADETIVNHVAAAPANIFTSDNNFAQPQQQSPAATQPVAEQSATPPTFQPAVSPTIASVPTQDMPAPVNQQPVAQQAPVFPPAQPVPGSAPAGALPQPSVPRGERKLEPLSDFSNNNVDFNALVDREIAKETAAVDQLSVATTDQERSEVQSQMQQFEQVAPQVSTPIAVTSPAPDPTMSDTFSLPQAPTDAPQFQAAPAPAAQDASVTIPVTQPLQPQVAPVAAPFVPQPQPVAQPVQPTNTSQPPTIQL